MSSHDDHDHKGPFEGRTYLYIRTHPSDNGTEPLSAGLPFWISPDIIIIKPGNIPGGEAVAGEVNQVQVVVTNAGGVTAVDAFVDAFVADPSTGWTPATAKFIGGDFLTIPGYNTASISFPWIPLPADAGHRCILARVALFVPPDTYVNGAIFDVVGDRHLAQRNIHVVALAQNMQSLSFGFLLFNAMGTRDEFDVQANEVRIDQNANLVRAAIGCGLAQFGATPLQDIRLLVADPVQPPDMSRPDRGRNEPQMGMLPKPIDSEKITQRHVKMGPYEARSAVLTVGRNPDTRPGDVHVVQVTQVDLSTRSVVGGLWVVVQH